MNGVSSIDVVVSGGLAIVHCPSTEDESLLGRGDSFFLFDTLFDLLDSVLRLNIQGDHTPSQGFDFDLHGLAKEEKRRRRVCLVELHTNKKNKTGRIAEKIGL